MIFPEIRFSRFIELRSKGIIGTYEIVEELLNYDALNKREAFKHIPDRFLSGIDNFLRFYPTTEFGWSMLPEIAPVHVNESSLDLNEIADIRRLPTRSIRQSVEGLKGLVRIRLEEIEPH